MNVKDHVLYRYAVRVGEENIGTENAWKEWKKIHPEKVEIYRKRLEKMFDETEFLVKATFDNKKEMANFYINREELYVFVVDETNQNIITLYPIDFFVPLQDGIKILDIHLKEILNLEEEIKLLNIDMNHMQERNQEIKSEIDCKIQSLKEELNYLEEQKRGLDGTLNNHRNNKKVLESKLKVKYKQIAKSIEFTN